MSIELLDRTRKVNRLLTEAGGEKVDFSDICKMVGGFLNSSVYVISRRGKLIMPGGNDTIELGDRVIVVTKHTGLSDLKDILK